MLDSLEEITPALSANEWMEFGGSKPFFDRLAHGGRPFGPNRRFTDEQKLHVLAALALWRHPAVFNHTELDALEAAAQLYERRHGPGDIALVKALRSAHKKIAALIPPAGVQITPSE
ncbi:MAG: hypothetical protein H0W63_03335 [Gemmatimonadaceae bacterium]|nr:hypothetical protein [Gemmatimonadaceae bacterium]